MLSQFFRPKVRRLAFALAGGGARGALQAGALRALVEAGYQPDLLVGTSIGALNAAFLALHGINSAAIKGLYQTWREAAPLDLLPSNYLWLTVRTLFNRSVGGTSSRMREFLIVHGLTPELQFKDLPGPRLYLVSTDMNAQAPFVYGVDPETSVLEGVMASATLPPWIPAVEKDGRLLMDGGVVSNLPIEPALSQGATDIIALDLHDPRPPANEPQGFGSFLYKLIGTVQSRNMELELALAAERKIPVRVIYLLGAEPVSIWDFTRSEELLERGYETARQVMAEWKQGPGQGGGTWLNRIFPGRKIRSPG